MNTRRRPPSPKRRTKTMLTSMDPGPSGFDIRTFECAKCDYDHQTAAGLVDPMKSRRTDGCSWDNCERLPNPSAARYNNRRAQRNMWSG
jgi:hypothetical protein